MHKIYLSDQDAISDLVKGKESALDHFFNENYTPITFFCLKLVKDQFASEEIATDTFIKLWNNRTSLSINGSIKTWLYSTARNASFDYLRKVSRIKQISFNIPEIEQSVLHRMIEAETIQQIIDSSKNLPTKCKQVFNLIMDGKSNEEIAEKMKISTNTVRNQKVRVIRLLRKSTFFQ